LRALKRWIRRWRAFRAAQPQLNACRPHLERIFGGPVTWRHVGGRGRDVVCRVLRAGKTVGMLRVAHPDTPFSTPPSAGLPFVSLSADEKIEREWQAYAAGFPLGLAPEPLWRDAHALLCAYEDATSLKQALDEGRALPLALAAEALPSLARLHAAGIAHMDMSLANILCDRAAARFLFVDFEYGPAAGLSFEQQCLYDYLRLLESVWKFLSPSERASASEAWGSVFLATAPEAVRSADPAPLWPALTRLSAAPELKSFFAALAAR